MKALLPKLDPADMPFPAVWDPSRYGVLFLARGYDEDPVQQEIVEGLAVAGITLRPIEAGAKQARAGVQRILRGAGQTALAQAAAKIKGASTIEPGHSDLAGNLAPLGRGLYFEVKRPAHIVRGKTLRRAGVPTTEQLAFLLARHSEGCIVGVVWSLSDVIHLISAAERATKRGA